MCVTSRNDTVLKACASTISLSLACLVKQNLICRVTVMHSKDMTGDTGEKVSVGLAVLPSLLSPAEGEPPM